MAKRPVPLYDFAAFGQAIKAARTARKESRKDVSDAMNISPRYLTNIENKGQQPSLQDVLNAFQLRPIAPDEVNLTPKLIRFNH